MQLFFDKYSFSFLADIVCFTSIKASELVSFGKKSSRLSTQKPLAVRELCFRKELVTIVDRNIVPEFPSTVELEWLKLNPLLHTVLYHETNAQQWYNILNHFSMGSHKKGRRVVFT